MPTTFFQENTSLFGQSKDKGLSKEKKKKTHFTQLNLVLDSIILQDIIQYTLFTHVSLTYDALEKTDQALPRG